MTVAHPPVAARLLAFAGFALLGIGGGAGGVLLPEQIDDYRVSKSVIGLLFFAFSLGYLIAGALTGPLLHRLGLRGAMVAGTVTFCLATAGSGLEPGFGPLLGLTVVFGAGSGVVDAVLNAYLADLPGRTALLNLGHACYGVGALAGPVLASALLSGGFSWGSVYLLLAVAGVLLLPGFLLRYPKGPLGGADGPRPGGGAGFATALRHPAVLLGALFLTIYVGIEVSLGNWAFSFLVEERGQAPLAAGWVVSLYWLGFTAGRFVLGALAARYRRGPVELTYGCLVALLAGTGVIWAVPGVPAAAAGLLLVGAALGPIFPLTIAVLPGLAPAWLVPTAVGLLVGFSVVGAAFFPWLAGTIAQYAGLGSLIPFLLLLAGLLVLNWWRIARRLRPTG